jgi:hypothetical protein
MAGHKCRTRNGVTFDKGQYSSISTNRMHDGLHEGTRYRPCLNRQLAEQQGWSEVRSRRKEECRHCRASGDGSSLHFRAFESREYQVSAMGPIVAIVGVSGWTTGKARLVPSAFERPIA